MNENEQKALEYLEREQRRAQKAEECDHCGENAARAHEVDTVKAVVGSILDKKPVFTFERLTETARLPERAHPTDAGWDIFADMAAQLYIGQTIPIKTGLRCSIPEGWEIQIRSRGSMALQSVCIANSPGTVDSGYRGEIKVLLISFHPYLYNIKPGDKIAQLIFSPTYDITLKEGVVKQDSDRNSNGFGSTGK